MSAASRKRPGFALLIVLWALLPLSAFFLTLASGARSDGQVASNLRTAAGLEAAAEAGIETATFALLGGRAPTGSSRLNVSGVSVTVVTEDISGRLNPNIASPELLRALLIHVGAAPGAAERIAAAVADWRTPGGQARPGGAKVAEYRAAGRDYGPPGAPFETLAELGDVLGMTPPMLSALLPNLSLDTDRPPDLAVAPPAIAAALADMGVRGGTSAPSDVFQIVAEAVGASGARAIRRATVKLGPSGDGRPWRILAWRDQQPQ